MNATLAIALGCLTCFILGVTAGMLIREKQFDERIEAEQDLLKATVRFIEAVKRERENRRAVHEEGEKEND